MTSRYCRLRELGGNADNECFVDVSATANRVGYVANLYVSKALFHGAEAAVIEQPGTILRNLVPVLDGYEKADGISDMGVALLQIPPSVAAGERSAEGAVTMRMRDQREMMGLLFRLESEVHRTKENRIGVSPN